jgi:hypothetical protein
MGREAEHSSLSSEEVSNGGAIPPHFTPLRRGAPLIKHRCNFRFMSIVSLLSGNKRLYFVACFHADLDNGWNIFFRNISWLSTDYTALHPAGWKSSLKEVSWSHLTARLCICVICSPFIVLFSMWFACYWMKLGNSFCCCFQNELASSYVVEDLLCGLLVRSRGPGSIPGTTRFSEKWWVWNVVHSASWVRLRSDLKEKLAAPV